MKELTTRMRSTNIETISEERVWNAEDADKWQPQEGRGTQLRIKN